MTFIKKKNFQQATIYYVPNDSLRGDLSRYFWMTGSYLECFMIIDMGITIRSVTETL